MKRFWRAYFSTGLVQPPTRSGLFLECHPRVHAWFAARIWFISPTGHASNLENHQGCWLFFIGPINSAVDFFEETKKRGVNDKLYLGINRPILSWWLRCPIITETKRIVSRFHETILRRWLDPEGNIYIHTYIYIYTIWWFLRDENFCEFFVPTSVTISEWKSEIIQGNLWGWFL